MPSKSEPEKDKISMRLDLNGKLKDRFEYLLCHYGQTTNTGLLRLLITIKYDEIKKKENEQK